MDEQFYKRFEDKFRGSRDLILSRLVIYCPFILPMRNIYPAPYALDLGCGRGEWLEILINNKFTPTGVDRDLGMIEDCRKRKLPVIQGDAIEYLSSLPSESQSVISAFHLVEHLTFNQISLLVSEAKRVLVPSGLLIIETPNPENILVATQNFYLDPTHQRPVPIDLLTYLLEYNSFYRTKVMRLQEPTTIADNQSKTLNDVLSGVSPDYAVVSQKEAAPQYLDLFNDAFNKSYGISMSMLSSGFDLHIQNIEEVSKRSISEADKANAIAIEVKAKTKVLETKVNSIEAKVKILELKTDEMAEKINDAGEKAMVAEAKAREIAIDFQKMQNSKEWRFLAKCHGIGNAIYWVVSRIIGWITFAPMSRPRRTIRKIIINAKNAVNHHPRIKYLIKRCLSIFPGLTFRLSRIGNTPAATSNTVLSVRKEDLTPKALRVYSDIIRAMGKN